jgi:NitT/TauT family transport system ATP-binding protein
VTGGGALVELDRVGMVYGLGSGRVIRALEEITLRIAPGCFCAVIGPSGCGKSTLLMLMAGLYLPTEGRVRIDGQVIERPWPHVGIVFQRDLLLEWRTVLDNVLLPIEIRRRPKKQYVERAKFLLGLVGLSGFEDYYPDQLSGGMRQRVAICRALIHDPALLLMDEPFAAVDALTRERLNIDLLKLIAESPKTTVFVTHSIEEAVFLADMVVVLSPRPGRILKVLQVPIERPRTPATRSDPRFVAAVGELRALLHSVLSSNI